MKKELIKALKTIRPAVGRGILNNPNSVTFANGWVYGVSDNLIISCKLETGIEAALPFEELLHVLQKFEKGWPIEISQDDTHVQFVCPHNRGTTTLRLLKLDKTEDFNKVELPDLDSVKWFPTPKRLLQGLKLSLLTADECPIGKLSGVFIDKDFILSSDNYKLSKYQLGEEINGPLRLFQADVESLVKLKMEFPLMAVEKVWLHLKNDTMTVSIRLTKPKYYPVEDLLDICDQANSFIETYELPEPKTVLRLINEGVEITAEFGDPPLEFDKVVTLSVRHGELIASTPKCKSRLPFQGYIPDITMVVSHLRMVTKLSRQFKVGPDRELLLFETDNLKVLTVAKVSEPNREEWLQDKRQRLSQVAQILHRATEKNVKKTV